MRQGLYLGTESKRRNDVVTYLMSPVSVQELRIVLSLWSHSTVLIEPGEPPTSFGGASGRFISNIRRIFSIPPVSKRWVSYKVKSCALRPQQNKKKNEHQIPPSISLISNHLARDSNQSFAGKDTKSLPLRRHTHEQCACVQRSATHLQSMHSIFSWYIVIMTKKKP